MSEYWKSTPKYWCKHCKTYVKDTKFERQQHEATGKHQGALKRFLRDIHKDQEREEREANRAKSEVERLNKLVPGSSNTAASSATTPTSGIFSKSATPAAPTIAERKKQMAQLAEMGIAIPEEYRRELALAGEWETIAPSASSTPVDPPDANLNVGVRKRKFEDQEEEEEAGGIVAKKGWGSATRHYPGTTSQDDDLDALLNGVASAAPLQQENAAIQSDKADDIKPGTVEAIVKKEVPVSSAQPAIKHEESQSPTLNVTQVVEPSSGPVLFKKRKPKVAKQT